MQHGSFPNRKVVPRLPHSIRNREIPGNWITHHFPIQIVRSGPNGGTYWYKQLSLWHVQPSTAAPPHGHRGDVPTNRKADLSLIHILTTDKSRRCCSNAPCFFYNSINKNTGPNPSPQTSVKMKRKDSPDELKNKKRKKKKNYPTKPIALKI